MSDNLNEEECGQHIEQDYIKQRGFMNNPEYWDSSVPNFSDSESDDLEKEPQQLQVVHLWSLRCYTFTGWKHLLHVDDIYGVFFLLRDEKGSAV